MSRRCAPHQRRVWSFLPALVAIVFAISVGFAAQPAHAQDDGLDVSTTVVYEPLPQLERIDVAATYTLTNRQADEAVGDSVRSFFFSRWVVALPSTVADFAATSNGVALTTSTEADIDTPDIILGTILLPFDLNFEETVQIDVTYTLPGGEPRTTSGTATRANESFLSFPGWAAGVTSDPTRRYAFPFGRQVTPTKPPCES